MFENTLAKFFKDTKDNEYNVNHDLFNALGGAVSVEIRDDQFKRQLISGNEYIDCILKYNAFSGSSFFNVKFLNCHLTGNGFIGSVFKNVIFNSKRKFVYSSNNWSQSYFYNCVFHNARIRSCTISQSLFLESEISDTSFSAITFENTVFRNCLLKNVDMHNINVDFMEFDDCELNNVKFDFFRLPFVFGGLKALNKNVILIDRNDKKVTSAEYINILPELARYYESRKEYFAACNIFNFLGQKAEAIKNLQCGIINSLEKSDYRSIKYFCKLGIIENIIQDEYAKNILENLENVIFGSSIHNVTETELPNDILLIKFDAD